MSREGEDVLRTFAQRGQLHRKDVEAVVEVPPEQAARDHLVEVAVGARDDAHVDPARTVGADGRDGAFLEHAQERDLESRARVAHFVEEDAAAVGLHEETRTILVAPVKAPRTWPKSSLSRR